MMRKGRVDNPIARAAGLVLVGSVLAAAFASVVALCVAVAALALRFAGWAVGA